MATVVKKTKSLKEAVAERTRVKFKFTDIIMEDAQDGSPIFRYILETPLDQVNGRVLTERGTNKSVALTAVDVQYVRMGAEALEVVDKLTAEGKSPIEWIEEGKSGTFDTNELKFDVSTRLEAWVVKTSLASFGAQQRGGSRVDSIAKQIEDFKAKQAMKKLEAGNVGNTNEPESVANQA